MKISILTLFPEMLDGFINTSIMKRAQEKNAVQFEIINIRDFAVNDYGSVDDKPYGGGHGMIMRIDCIYKALEKTLGKKPQKIKRDEEKATPLSSPHTIVTTARGKRYSQQKAMEYSELDHLVIITGHYEGIDERLAHYVNEEVSIGDFILTGGEIAAAGISDSTVRLLPDVLKERQATEEESFFEKDIDFLIENLGQQYELIKLKQKNIEKVMLIEYPQYTRPEEFEGCQVPEVLLSGNHAEIEKWRLKKAYEETKKRRPDLLE